MRVSLPNGWNKIPINKFPLIYDIVKDPDIDPIDREIRVISILTGLQVSTIEQIDLSDLRKLIKKVQFVFSMEFPKPVNEFNHCGYVWKMNHDVSKLSGGDFITLSKLTETEDSTINNLPQIVSLFAKPYKKRWFKLKPVSLTSKESIDMLSTVKASVIYPSAVFFCKVLSNSCPVIQDYLSDQLKLILKKIETEVSQSAINT